MATGVRKGRIPKRAVTFLLCIGCVGEEGCGPFEDAALSHTGGLLHLGCRSLIEALSKAAVPAGPPAAEVSELHPDCSSYLDVYARHGLATEKAYFAHCVHCTPPERLAMKERHCKVGTRPQCGGGWRGYRGHKQY